jgi:hypothetical protein
MCLYWDLCRPKRAQADVAAQVRLLSKYSVDPYQVQRNATGYLMTLYQLSSSVWCGVKIILLRIGRDLEEQVLCLFRYNAHKFAASTEKDEYPESMQCVSGEIPIRICFHNLWPAEILARICFHNLCPSWDSSSNLFLQTCVPAKISFRICFHNLSPRCFHSVLKLLWLIFKILAVNTPFGNL